jgi:type II secretory pathway component GspD/PulD (secretin)
VSFGRTDTCTCMSCISLSFILSAAAAQLLRSAYAMRTFLGSNHLMKNIIGLVIAVSALALVAGCAPPQAKAWKQTYSSFDLPSEHPAEGIASRLSYNSQGVPLEEVMKLYETLSGRTVIVGQLSTNRINFRSATPLNRIEALQMLDTVLAQAHIAMVLSGDKMVKAVPADKAWSESPPEITLPWRQLPESSSIMSRTVHLEHLRPSHTLPMLAPYANLPNGILPLDQHQTLLLRDYSSNVRQQLKLLEELDTQGQNMSAEPGAAPNRRPAPRASNPMSQSSGGR